MATPWRVQGTKVAKRGLALVGYIAVSYLVLLFILPRNFPAVAAISQSTDYIGQFMAYLRAGGSHAAINLYAAGPFLVIFQGTIMSGLLLLFAVWPLFDSSLYGAARWGNIDDAQAQELISDSGMVLGVLKSGWHKIILRAKHERNAIVIAPTRRGKTRGNVITTILDYPGSVIAISTKTELAEHTRDYRSTLAKTHLIRWADPKTPDGWSFTDLKTLPRDPVQLERHAANCSGLLFPPINGENKHFQDTGRRYCNVLFEFFMLEAIRKNESYNVADMVNKLSSLAAEAKAMGDDDRDTPLHVALNNLSEEARHHGYPRRVVSNLAFFSSWDNRELGIHTGTVLTGLDVLTYESVRHSTSTSTFSFADLRREPRTVYIEFPQSDRTVFGQLTALFFQALISYGLDNPPQRGEYGIKIVADEFKSLPKIPNLTDLFTSGAGNAITMMMILQDFASVIEIYGQQGFSELWTNATYTVAFGQNNLATQKQLSEKVGQETRSKISRTSVLNSFMGGSRSSTLEGAPLVRPEDWGSIPFGYNVILTDGFAQQPIYCQTPFWDLFATFRNRVPSSCLKAKA